MLFTYRAKTKGGINTSGEVEAADRESGLRELKRQGLMVVLLEVAHQKREGFSLLSVGVFERVVLTKHLGIMLKAGVALDEALRIAEVSNHGKLRFVMRRVREAVESGQRLADALAAHPKVFSPYYVNMVRAGEESGHLPENLEQLAARFSKDYELKQKALSAMLYPALVASLTFGLALIIALFVLPRLSTLFSAFKFELPLTTRILMWLSKIAATDGTWIAVVFVVAFLIFLLVVRTAFARPLVHGFLLRAPVFRSICRPLNLARFANVLGSLLKSGLPINAALAVTEQVVGNVHYKRTIREASVHVDRGEPLSAALSGHEWLFPPFAYRMIQIGDETGKTEEVLFYLSEFYENELDVTLKNLSTVIEPAMLISIGAIVAIVALSIITPIYGFINAIG